MGAALSYYALFSLAPLLVIVIAVAGLVFGAEAARAAVVAQMSGLLGTESGQLIQQLLEAASEPRKGLVASVIGAGTLVAGASGFFLELQSDLDRIWKAKKPAPAGWWTWLRSRLLS